MCLHKFHSTAVNIQKERQTTKFLDPLGQVARCLWHFIAGEHQIKF